MKILREIHRVFFSQWKQIFGYILHAEDVVSWGERFPEVGIEHLTFECEDMVLLERERYRLSIELKNRELGRWVSAYTCNIVSKCVPLGAPTHIRAISMGDNLTGKGLMMARDVEGATRLKDFLGRSEAPKWIDLCPDYSRVANRNASSKVGNTS